ncbi:MAG: class I SAM-dependent methyltransferase [Chloroflexi bacterium]|nr:class I SAM-dependent methyltransferase [Chloroflexota bacterium]
MLVPNTEYWMDKRVSDYDRRQRLLAPRKDEMLDTLIDFLPFQTTDKIHVVDIGVGQGALSEKILNRFPDAHITLLDNSSEMLEIAEKRLVDFKPRFSIVHKDFNSTEVFHSVTEPVDAVVSSVALHYLVTGNRLPFAKKVFNLLSTPGCFINGGVFHANDEFVQKRIMVKMIEYTQKQLLEIDGVSIPLDKLGQRRKEETESAGVNRIQLANQFEILKEAGFCGIEIVWRYLVLAVVVGYKRMR